MTECPPCRVDVLVHVDAVDVICDKGGFDRLNES
jgi:hypothetical protein